MKVNNRAQLAGMAGAVLWIISLVLEYPLGLYSPGGSGPLYVANQILAIIALAGIAVGILGISWGGGIGGRLGQTGVWLFALGYVLIILGGIMLLFISTFDSSFFVVFPIGAFMMDVGALLTGIAVIKDHRWSGWQRFMPFIYAVYFWLAIEVPFMMGFYGDAGPGFVPELFQAVGLFFVALAGYTAQSKSEKLQMTTA
jgi:hypothetical protein